MNLCVTCRAIDFEALLVECLRRCQHKQAADRDDYDEVPDSPQKHHSDIFQIQASAQACGLCKLILQAFEERKVSNVDDARGIPIVFRTQYNKVEVSYDSSSKYIKLCGLDWYMNGTDVYTLFHAFKIKEDEAPPVHKVMERHAGSRMSLQTAASWLRNCINNHIACGTALTERKPPKRLIHIGYTTENIRLIETASMSRNIEWVALSYCWGVEKPSLKLNKDTKSRMKNGFSVRTLDATIMDAVLVVRQLELQYIWIDALCIDQDEDAKEWEEEATRMDEIYGGSTVTLVAASSRSTVDGILLEREVEYIPVQLRQESATKLFLSKEWMSDYDEVSSSWGKRGWTMQEGLLPHRILYYTPSQMVWRCCVERSTERGTTKSVQNDVDEFAKHGDEDPFELSWLWRQDSFLQFKKFSEFIASDPKHISGSNQVPLLVWYQLTIGHSQRQFTEEKDRLVAISGLARIISKTMKSSEYAAGLWKSDLIRGLLWYIVDSKLVTSTVTHGTIPSWSWASVGNQLINYALGNADQYTAVSRIEDVHVNLVDPLEPFGSTTGGKITITGPLKRLSRLYDERWKTAEAPLSELERHFAKLIEKQSLHNAKLGYMAPSRGPYAALQMARGGSTLHLILLEAAGGSDVDTNIYHRIGVCTLRHFHNRDFAKPGLLSARKESSNSLAKRLGPIPKPPRREDNSIKAYHELTTQQWDEETIYLI